MPLLKLQSAGKEQAWAIWQIQETEQELSFSAHQTCPDEIVHPQKRLEFLAGRTLIKLLAENCGMAYLGMSKDEFGKPFLKEHPHHISLSHSFPLVAAQIDKLQSVGIDIEQPKEKLRNIAHRIFSPSEVKDAGNDLVKLCIYWCAKEVLYKIYGKRNLLFSDHLQVLPFTLGQEGVINGIINVDHHLRNVILHYSVMNGFVLVYTQSVN